MASPEKVHYSVFPVTGTVNERGLILHVRERHFNANTVLTQGTTLADFMSTENVEKGDALAMGFGPYVYREQLPKEGNTLRFLFLKPKDATEQLQLVKPKFTINEVTDWPNWLLSLYMLDAVVSLQTEKNSTITTSVTGRRFLDRYILIRGGNFNTTHEVEEFFSPTPITSLTATEPRPDLVFYNYFGTSNQIECVHSRVTIPEPYISATLVPNFGTENTREVVWQDGSVFPQTNHIGWIPHYRKLIVTERDGGFYYRRHRVLPPKLNRAIQI